LVANKLLNGKILFTNHILPVNNFLKAKSMKTQLVFEGCSPRTSTGAVFATLQEHTRLRKDQIGRIEVGYKHARVDLEHVEKDDLLRLVKDLEHCQIQDATPLVWCSTPLVWCSTPLVELHQSRGAELLKLLLLELEEEQKESQRALDHLSDAEKCKAGLMIRGLSCEDWEVSASGHLLCHLAFNGESPWRKGLPILLNNSSEWSCEGLLVELRPNLLSVMLNGSTEQLDHLKGSLSLVKKESEVTHERRSLAIQRALGLNQNAVNALLDIFDPPLLQKHNLKNFVLDAPEPVTFEPINQRLNKSQMQAVTASLTQPTLTLIHGPPGTGKSTVLQEIIAQLVRQGLKVLICAPSNSAVDQLLHLCKSIGGLKFRWGHPGRIHAQNQDYCFEASMTARLDAGLQKAFLKQIRQIKNDLSKGNLPKDIYRATKQELKECQQAMMDVERRERAALWQDAQMVFATLTSLDPNQILSRAFDVVIIDEAAQCIEPDIWCALPFAKRMVLAGDPEQLPAVVKSSKASALACSLMEKLISREGLVRELLQIQYRMHGDIADFSSQRFYQGQLSADPSVAQHRLGDLDQVELLDPYDSALVFVDTAGADYDEQWPDQSCENIKEAQFVAHWVNSLLAGGLKAEEIGVITPYSAQVQRIKGHCRHEGVEIHTIDGFQGREKEAIVISCVRSNAKGEVGFLSDTRRMNVALTRARRHLCIIGDSSTLGHHEFYEALLTHMENLGALRSIYEFELD
jgi:ATP-dependent RNA/DNA helicase IGHMBP2